MGLLIGHAILIGWPRVAPDPFGTQVSRRRPRALIEWGLPQEIASACGIGGITARAILGELEAAGMVEEEKGRWRLTDEGLAYRRDARRNGIRTTRATSSRARHARARKGRS